ncbi:hypothetical protein DERF_002129 [Dermatophagoides farinae]|uniref:Uncharacterized protein n=1 Tax=Dermatophagoides farinae TaxID=6954 RepID=A0A922LD79_DERFA|nr:hypothetical protein DERF_002129 [Dermatophagoides farinae]
MNRIDDKLTSICLLKKDRVGAKFVILDVSPQLIIFTKSNNKKEKKAAKSLLLKCAEKLSDIWILDSGCTSHTTIDKNLLMDQEDKQIEFELANDVAYGGFSSNLISVRKLIEGGFKINFEENLAQITKNEISFNLWIIDNKLKNIIMNI